MALTGIDDIDSLSTTLDAIFLPLVPGAELSVNRGENTRAVDMRRKTLEFVVVCNKKKCATPPLTVFALQN
jgi:hypothetical protein